MFQYAPPAASPIAAAAPLAPAPLGLTPAAALSAARRNAGIIATFGLAGALVAYLAAQTLTPKYLATAEIYVDPSAAQSATADPVAPGQDSNSFVAYVESQALIIKSRSVLERVARAEGLDRDSEFGGEGAPSVFSILTHSASDPPSDAIAAAARALDSHIQVRRPERTFVLDIAATARTPERAAKIANAAAEAYIEEVVKLRAEGARQTGAAIAAKLEALRAHVIDAEQAIETYKADKGLVGAKDVTLISQQLRNLDDQITAQKTKASDARGRAEGAEAARRAGGDLGAFAAQFGLMTLSALRGQQAEAKQKLADTLAELGPRHPQAIEAQARFDAANHAVDAELDRFARSQRLEYQRALATQADLQRQLGLLKSQTHTDDEAMVGLRDLERKAQAARDIYELFVARSRDTGEIQDVAPVRTKVISAASPPKTRSFPPSASVIAALGLAGGLGLGFLLALTREAAKAAKPQPAAAPPIARASEQAPKEPRKAPEPQPAAEAPPQAPEPVIDEPPAAAEPLALSLGRLSTFEARAERQTLETLDLSALGLPTLPQGERREIDEILDALATEPPTRQIVAVTGEGRGDERSALALNLALAAADRGASVALVDAVGRNAKLTRAVRYATMKAVLEGGPTFETVNGVLLVLPKAGATGRGRIRPAQALSELIAERGDEFDLIVCDGPDAAEIIAPEIFALANALVALDDAATRERLDDIGYSPYICVRFETPEPEPALKRA